MFHVCWVRFSFIVSLFFLSWIMISVNNNDNFPFKHFTIRLFIGRSNHRFPPHTFSWIKLRHFFFLSLLPNKYLHFRRKNSFVFARFFSTLRVTTPDVNVFDLPNFMRLHSFPAWRYIEWRAKMFFQCSIRSEFEIRI